MNLSSLSGMQAASELVDRAARATAGFGASMSSPTAAGAGVDLAEQVANLIMGTLAYDANARVLEAQDATTRAAIDLLV